MGQMEFSATIKLITGEEIFAKVTPCEEDNKDLLLLYEPVIISAINTVNGYVNESGSILFPLDESRRLKTTWVKITDWSPIDSKLPGGNRNRRGRITQDFKIAPHWEHVVMNENGY